MKTSYVEMAKKLREATGKPKPADAFLADLERRETEREAKRDAEFAKRDAEIAQFRTDIRADFAQFRTDIRTESAQFRTDIRADFAQFRADVHHDLASIKWMMIVGLAFIGTVLAVNSF